MVDKYANDNAMILTMICGVLIALLAMAMGLAERRTNTAHSACDYAIRHALTASDTLALVRAGCALPTGAT